jgi:hypothetical protein
MTTTTPFAVETTMMQRHFDGMKPIWIVPSLFYHPNERIRHLPGEGIGYK